MKERVCSRFLGLPISYRLFECCGGFKKNIGCCRHVYDSISLFIQNFLLPAIEQESKKESLVIGPPKLHCYIVGVAIFSRIKKS